jgi:hypothetical protein
MRFSTSGKRTLGPGSLAWRFRKVGQTWFALSGNPGELANLGRGCPHREDKIDRYLTVMLDFGVGTILARWNLPNNQVPVQKFRNVVSILFINSMNESELPEAAL